MFKVISMKIFLVSSFPTPNPHGFAVKGAENRSPATVLTFGVSLGGQFRQ